MTTRQDIESEAEAIHRLIQKATNPTSVTHTPMPWRKGDPRECGGGSIETDTGLFISYFRRAEDRDVALYFANQHAALISLFRSHAAAFHFIAAGADDEGLYSFASQMGRNADIYADIFCRLGQIEDAPDLPMPPEDKQ